MSDRVIQLTRSLFVSGLRGAFVLADIFSVVKGWVFMPKTLQLMDEWVRQPMARAVDWCLAMMGFDLTTPAWAPTAYLSCVMIVGTVAAILRYSPRLRPLSETVALYTPPAFQRSALIAIFLLAPLTILLLLMLAFGDRKRLYTILFGLGLSLAGGMVLLTIITLIVDPFID